MKDRTLLTVAQSVQMNIANFGLTLRNPFSVTTILTRRNIAEVMLTMTDTVNTVVGLALIPRKESFSKKLSRPPVVAVSVVAISRRTICIGI